MAPTHQYEYLPGLNQASNSVMEQESKQRGPAPSPSSQQPLQTSFVQQQQHPLSQPQPQFWTAAMSGMPFPSMQYAPFMPPPFPIPSNFAPSFVPPLPPQTGSTPHLASQTSHDTRSWPPALGQTVSLQPAQTPVSVIQQQPNVAANTSGVSATSPADAREEGELSESEPMALDQDVRKGTVTIAIELLRILHDHGVTLAQLGRQGLDEGILKTLYQQMNLPMVSGETPSGHSEKTQDAAPTKSPKGSSTSSATSAAPAAPPPPPAPVSRSEYLAKLNAAKAKRAQTSAKLPSPIVALPEVAVEPVSTQSSDKTSIAQQRLEQLKRLRQQALQSAKAKASKALVLPAGQGLPEISNASLRSTSDSDNAILEQHSSGKPEDMSGILNVDEDAEAPRPEAGHGRKRPSAVDFMTLEEPAKRAFGQARFNHGHDPVIIETSDDEGLDLSDLIPPYDMYAENNNSGASNPQTPGALRNDQLAEIAQDLSDMSGTNDLLTREQAILELKQRIQMAEAKKRGSSATTSEPALSPFPQPVHEQTGPVADRMIESSDTQTPDVPKSEQLEAHSTHSRPIAIDSNTAPLTPRSSSQLERMAELKRKMLEMRSRQTKASVPIEDPQLVAATAQTSANIEDHAALSNVLSQAAKVSVTDSNVPEDDSDTSMSISSGSDSEDDRADQSDGEIVEHITDDADLQSSTNRHPDNRASPAISEPNTSFATQAQPQRHSREAELAAEESSDDMDLDSSSEDSSSEDGEIDEDSDPAIGQSLDADQGTREKSQFDESMQDSTSDNESANGDLESVKLRTAPNEDRLTSLSQNPNALNVGSLPGLELLRPAEKTEEEEYEPPEPIDDSMSVSVSEPNVSQPVNFDSAIEQLAQITAQSQQDDKMEAVRPPTEAEQTKKSNHAAMHASDQSEVSQIMGEKFVEYKSPLRLFKAFRLNPHYNQSVTGGFRSLTYSHDIDAQKELCPYETSGGACNDRSCPSQHFRDFAISDDTLIRQMIQMGNTDRTEDQQQQFFKQLSTATANVKDSDTAASIIAAEHRRFQQELLARQDE